MKRVLGAAAACLMVIGVLSAFSPAAGAEDAVPPPLAPTRSTADAIPGTDAATSRSIEGHIDLGAAGHPAAAGDVTITIFGWVDNDEDQWLHYFLETHPDAAGNFTLALGQLDYVILQYDYIGPGNFVSAYSGEFLAHTPGGNPGGYHLTKPITTVAATLRVGGSIGGTVLDTGLPPGTAITASPCRPPTRRPPRRPRAPSCRPTTATS